MAFNSYITCHDTNRLHDTMNRKAIALIFFAFNPIFVASWCIHHIIVGYSRVMKVIHVINDNHQSSDSMDQQSNLVISMVFQGRSSHIFSHICKHLLMAYLRYRSGLNFQIIYV